MDLQLLRFFVTVAREGGFTPASEVLHYAQSNLSTRIRQLENELGQPLFYRHKKGVSLTARGKLFYEYANQILKLSDDAISAVRDMDHARGSLAIGSLEATALGDLPSLLSSYHQSYPEVHLSLKTDMNDVFQNLVLARELDGAFVAEASAHHELSRKHFRDDRLILVGAAHQNDADIVSLLNNSPIVTFPDGSVFRRRFELLLTALGIVYPDRLVVLNSLGAMLANIISGLGIGYLPFSIVRSYLEQGLMRQYLLEEEDPYSLLNIMFIYRRDHIMNAAFRSFLAEIQ